MAGTVVYIVMVVWTFSESEIKGLFLNRENAVGLAEEISLSYNANKFNDSCWNFLSGRIFITEWKVAE